MANTDVLEMYHCTTYIYHTNGIRTTPRQAREVFNVTLHGMGLWVPLFPQLTVTGSCHATGVHTLASIFHSCFRSSMSD